MNGKKKMTEQERQVARQAAADKRRALLNQEKALDLFARAEMLQAAGEIRTTDGARLSDKNTLLVYMQARGAGFSPSLVGGFKQWREQGRTVRKGARGWLICFPKMGKNEETGADEAQGFGWGYVFDISQTAERGQEENGQEQEQEQEQEQGEQEQEQNQKQETEQARAPEVKQEQEQKQEQAQAPDPAAADTVNPLAAVMAAIAAA